MELFMIAIVFGGVVTTITAIDEYFDWFNSYERAAQEQKEENFDD